jgi:uncharacterized protein (TIGR02996 family)
VDDARNLELEARILEAPEDPAAYLVYADWLQAAGDPRGGLIVAQAARAARPNDEGLAAAEGKLLEAHREALIGPWPDQTARFSIGWYLGFWRALQIEGPGWSPRGARDEDVAALLAAPSVRFLRELSCSGPLTPGVLALAAPLARTLHDLEIILWSHGLFRDDDLRALAPLVELRRLALFSCELVTARGLEVLAGLPHLASIDLRNCSLSDDGVRCLAGLPLTYVKFNAISDDLTEDGMRLLAAAPLRSLHLTALDAGTPDVWPFAEHPTLRELELSAPRISRHGATALGSMPALRRLLLRGSTLDDRGAAELAPLAGRLRTLDLRKSKQITDAACEILVAFDWLTFLDLSSTGIGGAGVRRLSRLRQLEHLDLGYLDLDDDDVGALASLSRLRSLCLAWGQRITDRTVETLVQLPTLERLDLAGTRITGDGLERLFDKLPKLVELGLQGCADEAIERAQGFRIYVTDRNSIDIDDDFGEDFDEPAAPR